MDCFSPDNSEGTSLHFFFVVLLSFYCFSGFIFEF